MKKVDVLKDLAETIINLDFIENTVTHYNLRNSIDIIVKTVSRQSGKSIDSIYKVTGLTKQQYYRRLKNSDLWTKKELIALFKHVNKLRTLS